MALAEAIGDSERKLGKEERAALRRLLVTSDRAGLLQLLPHLMLIAVGTLLIAAADGTLWLWPAMLFQGIVLIFLFAPLHESIHGTAFKSRRLNQAVARVAGFLLLLPADYFRLFHFAHHRHTQDPERDPELATPKPKTLGQWAWHVSGAPYWLGNGKAMLQHALGRVDVPFIPDAQKAAIVREARWHLLIYALLAAASVAAGSDALLIYWVVPVLLGQPFLRLYLLAEHTLCPLVPDMYANTRTTFTNRALRFLCWNMCFHVEHHAYPGLPFHALPNAHEVLAPRLKVTAPGYLAVTGQILKAVRG